MIGIYSIVHKDSGRVYVGSAMNISRRFTAHRSSLRRGVHHSLHFQRAWDKYGEQAFVWSVIEECDEAILIAREQYWIDKLQATDQKRGYNVCPIAGTSRGAKFGPQSPEHRAKIGAAHKGKKASAETRAALSRALKGRRMSPEWIAKIAAANVGRKMAPLTPEHKAIVSAAHKGKTISDAHKKRLSEAHTGRRQSEETRAKRAATMRAIWAQRKAASAATENV